MQKLLIATLLASLILIVSGVVLSLVMSDATREFSQKFAFQMNGTERFFYHVALRILAALALATLIFIVAQSNSSVSVLIAVVVAAWFLSYVPGFLILADIGALSLKAAIATMLWGFAEF